MSDKYIAGLVGTTESEVRELRKSFGITPKYGIIDVCGKDKGGTGKPEAPAEVRI